MTKHLTATLAAGAAVLGLAGAAPRRRRSRCPSDAGFDVPAGQGRAHRRRPAGLRLATRSRATRGPSRGSAAPRRTRSSPTCAPAGSGRDRRHADRDPHLQRRGRRRPRRAAASGRAACRTTLAFERPSRRPTSSRASPASSARSVVDGRRALVTESVEGSWRTDEPASVHDRRRRRRDVRAATSARPSCRTASSARRRRSRVDAARRLGAADVGRRWR